MLGFGGHAAVGLICWALSLYGCQSDMLGFTRLVRLLKLIQSIHRQRCLLCRCPLPCDYEPCIYRMRLITGVVDV